MKKILELLCVISISASTFSVASCSFINTEKQSIKNKVENLMNISSVLLRGTMIQKSNEGNKELSSYDSNFLNTIVGNTKAIDTIKGFDTDRETSINDLHSTYFDMQDLSRDAINSKNNNFLSNNVKSPSGPLDQYGDTLVLIISILKANGGIHPSLSGIIEGILPQINIGDEKLANNLTSNKLKPISNFLEQTGPELTKLIGFLQESKILNSVLKNFFNSEFINAIKDKDISSTSSWIDETVKNIDFKGLLNSLDNFINSSLTIDKKAEELTGQMIINASLNRISNIFARASQQLDKVIGNENLYEPLGSKFDTNLGEIIAKFLEKIGSKDETFDFSKFLTLIISEPENIVDFIFFISGILKYISSIDFSQYNPKDDKNLFSSEKSNNDFLEELNNKNLKENPFSSKTLFKNLIEITDTNKDPFGKQTQKLFYMLFNSGKSPTNIDKNITLINLFVKLKSGSNNLKNNYSSLLYGLGNGIAVWQEWNYKNFGPDSVGNLFRWVIGDGLGHNSDFSGLNKVLDILGDLGIKIDLRVSEETTDQLKHLFNSIWDENSTLFKDLLGLETNLYSIFSIKISSNGTISEILRLIYNSIEGETINQGQKLKEGISIVAKNLISEEFTLWYKNKGKLEQFKDFSYENKGNYNALQVLILASKRSGLILSTNNQEPNNLNIKGNKAIMAALGTLYDNNGNQINNNFKEESLLAGVEKIFDDEIVKNVLDDIANGFIEIKNLNSKIIKEVYLPLIKSENFKTKLISKENIDKKNKIQQIKYITTYKDPFLGKEFRYQVILTLALNDQSWKVEKIKLI
ncbi:hypothetical protein [Spiroplasma monobiae]|uniref:MOLPALP family lipoprotein n=1 Tax=Spiroplasma monobiae MQ-1 TaxID=1336748 RepID=A0A2K9LU29_SPISQ|nr:hypothetical protein [Spiroplasma monobiae]AUM62562.1 hypothetical protein SMONO_v1c03130 [Spiroplasma monobiae MQ-1]